MTAFIVYFVNLLISQSINNKVIVKRSYTKATLVPEHSLRMPRSAGRRKDAHCVQRAYAHREPRESIFISYYGVVMATIF